MNDLLHARYLRQLDLCPSEKLTFPITLIGAGAIGSATAVTLAKMGCTSLTVWDHDVLNEHNLPNQLCRPAMIGRPKVEALAELVFDLTEAEIQARPEKYLGQRLEGVVIAAVDSMDVRQTVWKRCRMNAAVPLLIDGRMGAELARLYAVRPTDPEQVEFYESNLYTHDGAEHLPCSARSIIYCPALIGGLVAAQVKRYAVGQPLRREILLDVPGLELISQ